jgi:oligopeptide transport system permease protein
VVTVSIENKALIYTPSAEEFEAATQAEKESQIVMRESVGFWKDGMRRLRKNPLAMTSLAILIAILIFAFIVPAFYPYTYEQQVRGSENLAPGEYSESELELIASGEEVFPHFFGTDVHGRDYAVRVMMGARVSLVVGIGAALLILLIGSIYGAISGFLGGRTDIIMMRIVEVLSTVPEILVIILLMMTLRFPLNNLADSVPGFAWIRTVGVPVVCIFIVFGLLYWMNMARIVRSQILTLKESDFVTAAKALGASNKRIIKNHLLTNCIGTLIVTTALQIPQVIFTESFLSFVGIGIAAPMPSLGSLATDAVEAMQSYPHRLFIPAILITVIILTLNLFGDGLRDAFDPKLKQ